MKLRNIITRRLIEKHSSWDLVFEWEDEIRDILNCHFYYTKKYFRGRGKVEKLIKKFPFLYFLLQTYRKSFVFEMMEFRKEHINNKSNIVPCIIDCYPNSYPLNTFISQYCNNRIVFLTSKQVYDYYKEQELPFKIAHLPISLPSKYAITSQTKFSKCYDAALIGRPNPILESYLGRYAAEHPSFTYVYHKLIDNNHCYLVSDGANLGDLDTRDKYMSLLKKVRVGLYSTSGMDNDKLSVTKYVVNTGEFHQVTPRYLEMIACGCHIMARYEDNSDTEYFELTKFCESINTYEQFENKMNLYLSTEPDLNLYSAYLKKHYTSVRAYELNEILASEI